MTAASKYWNMKSFIKCLCLAQAILLYYFNCTAKSVYDISTATKNQIKIAWNQGASTDAFTDAGIASVGFYDENYKPYTVLINRNGEKIR